MRRPSLLNGLPAMPSLPFLLAGGVLAAAATIAVVERPLDQPPDVRGHLILQTEGDARALDVTRITVKPDPFGHLAGVQSEFAIELRDAAGRLLGSYPLELDRFDMDPAHVGRDLRVEGCVIVDTRVAALVNVPDFVAAAELRILRGAQVLGRVEPARLARMVVEGHR
jgi:hypothetical protein